jgi:FkbM family methyltransferase
MRRARSAISQIHSLRFICRLLDFLCCSLPPSVVLRTVACGADSFALWLRVNDPSHYDLTRGHYETVVTKWLEESLKPGDVFWDIGSNVGLYAVRAARIVGPTGFVVAIEADPEVAAILTKSCEVNHLSHCRVISGAMTDHTGTVRLGRAPATGWTGLYYEKPDEWIDVPGLTGDSLMNSLGASRIDAVKIDVEGAEGHVLAGMIELLTKIRPKLLIEVHRAHAGVEQEVLKILGVCGFETRALDRADATMHIAAQFSVKPAVMCSAPQLQ